MPAAPTPWILRLLREGIWFRSLPAALQEEFVRRSAVRSYRRGQVVTRAGTRVDGLYGLLEGRLLGKPENDAEAVQMLTELAGKTHEVLTGVVILAAYGRAEHVERTRVTFLPLSRDEIAWYVRSGEPRDKAGAYAVQGLASRFVSRIEGSYSNVVGLPVAAVTELLKQMTPVGRRGG